VVGGAGGSASVTASSIAVPNSGQQNSLSLEGGGGGSVTDLSGGTNTGGTGGSAVLNAGSVILGNFSSLALTGGAGGTGVTGGAGGGATLQAGSLAVTYGLSVNAGKGGNGLSTGGVGGSAAVSFGSLIQATQYQYFSVTGGNGGASSGASGNGGNAFVEGGSVSITGNSGFLVNGGGGGSFGYGLGGTVNGGNGGNAGVSLGSLYDSSNAAVTIAGGSGGAGSSGSAPGSGGNGGNTSFSLGNFTINGTDFVVLSGGAGGAGGGNTTAGLGGAGGGAGSLSVTFGTLTLATGSGLTLSGNTGGNGGNSTGGTGGAGGNGGNLSFSAGAVTLASGSSLDLAGGAGGTGGTGGTQGANGAQGTISTTMGNFLNQGNFFLDRGNVVLRVGSNFTQDSSGSLYLKVGGAGGVSSDSVSVGGTASLNGTLDLTSYGTLSGLPVGNSFVLVNASSVSGNFQQVNESFTGIRLLPLYLSNAVELESINPSFQGSGETPNQKSIGADLDSIALKPQVNGLMQFIGVLPNAALQTAYGQLSPEDFTAAYQAGFERAQARMALVDQRLSQLMADVDSTAWLPGFSGAGTPWFAANLPAAQEAAMAPHSSSVWGGFASGDSGFFNVTGDSNAAGYKVTTVGLTGAGVDIRLSREMALGLMVGYGHTDVTLGTGGSLTADGGQFGLYGLFYSEGFYAGALAEGGVNSYGTQRQAYGGLATGSTQGSQWDGALELGYQFKAGQMKLGPLASVQYGSVGMNGFTEQGSQAPLTVPNQSESSLLSRLGVRAGSQWSFGGGSSLNPSIQLAWEHEYNYQGGAYQAGFGAGDSFTVAGPQVGQDGLAAGAGLGLTFAKSLTVSLNYQGEFGRTHLNSNQFGGGLRLGF